MIGAGVGGMCVAARLAKQGHQVTIYEASHQSGGKCRTEWIGDYAFDTGPSLLTLPAIYKDFFLKTGPRFESVLAISAVNPSFAYHFADGKSVKFVNLDLPKTCEAIDESIDVEAGNAWHALMQRAELMWDISRVPFIQSELNSMWSLLKSRGLIRGIRHVAPFKSLRQITREYTKDPHVQMIIDRYATYTGSDPRKAPAALLMIAFVESSFGAWHLAGGIGQLSVALEERCRLLKVDLHLNSPVSAINTHSGIVTGVTLSSGEVVAADLVVANVDAEIVYNQLLDRAVKEAKPERRKLKRGDKSLAGFSLLLGLDNSNFDGVAPQMNHHSIYFPENYDAEFDQIFTQRIPVEDPTIYICAPNDPLMVKGSGKESWFVLVNAPRHDPKEGWDWSAGGGEYAQKIIAKLDALGLRVSERLDVMEFRTPLDLQSATNSPGGSIYGTSSNGARAAFSRAKNRSPVEGLFCVGGSAHPGGGLPLVGMSAELVAGAIGSAQTFVTTTHNHH